MFSEKVWARKHCSMGQANSRTSGDRAQNTVPNGMKLIFPRALFLFTLLPTSCLEERPFRSQGGPRETLQARKAWWQAAALGCGGVKLGVMLWFVQSSSAPGKEAVSSPPHAESFRALEPQCGKVGLSSGAWLGARLSSAAAPEPGHVRCRAVCRSQASKATALSLIKLA